MYLTNFKRKVYSILQVNFVIATYNQSSYAPDRELKGFDPHQML
jgi:hypothetical protein